MVLSWQARSSPDKHMIKSRHQPRYIHTHAYTHTCVNMHACTCTHNAHIAYIILWSRLLILTTSDSSWSPPTLHTHTQCKHNNLVKELLDSWCSGMTRSELIVSCTTTSPNLSIISSACSKPLGRGGQPDYRWPLAKCITACQWHIPQVIKTSCWCAAVDDILLDRNSPFCVTSSLDIAALSDIILSHI